MRYLRSFLCIVMAALGVGCNKQPPAVSNAAPKPFFVTENDSIIHELYRGITFEQFTQSIPSGSIDSIDFDSTIQDYAIAVVTAPRQADEDGLQFTTTFITDNQEKIVKAWTMASGNNGDKVRGLFLIPTSVTSATTIRSSSSAEQGGAQLDQKSSNPTAER